MAVESVNVFAAFIFGMLSFLSPCVLPLLPGYMSMMSGYSAVDVAEGKPSTGRMLRVKVKEGERVAAGGLLTAFRPDIQIPGLSYGVLCLPERVRVRKIARFIRWLEAALEQD